MVKKSEVFVMKAKCTTACPVCGEVITPGMLIMNVHSAWPHLKCGERIINKDPEAILKMVQNNYQKQQALHNMSKETKHNLDRLFKEYGID